MTFDHALAYLPRGVFRDLSVPPDRSYILCTSPRSGSTLLCHMLRATGVAGHPGSHFHEPSLAAWLDAYDLADQRFVTERAALESVVAAAMSYGKGRSDMFALRLQRQSAAFFVTQLGRLHPGLPHDRARIEAVFGPTTFLYLRREDKLAQAISYLVAQQSGLWHRAPDGREIERLSAPQVPVYDGAGLARQIAEFEAFDAAWQAWFRQEKIKPFELTYEALAADPLGCLALVLEYLGLDGAQAAHVSIPVARLADEINSDWAARFRAGER